MNPELFQGTISKYMILRHIRTREQLRMHTSIGSNKTFSKYWHNPDLMPIENFEQIMKALNIPLEEQLNLIRGGKK